MNRYKQRNKTLAQRFWEKVDVKGKDDCWMWNAYVDSDGYGQFRYYDRQQKAHRSAWILTHGEIPEGMFVCHHCDTPSCVNPAHLFIGTHQDNVDDQYNKGRGNFGERHGRSKLTEQEVLLIRDLYDNGCYTQEELSDMYHISRGQIGAIVRKESWAYL